LEAIPDTYYNVSSLKHNVQITSKYIVENDTNFDADSYNPWILSYDIETF